MRSFGKLMLVITAALTLAACGDKGASSGAAGGGLAAGEDMFLGRADAPVEVIDYSSVACPHCANFHNNVFPTLKEKYVDTGQVKWVAREFLTGDPRLAAAGYLLARCAGKDKYFDVTDAIYRRQMDIYQSGDLRGGLLQIALSVGMSEDEFMKCVSDETALEALNKRVEGYAKQHSITGTPTFLVDGKKVSAPGADGGELTLEQFETAIAEALAAKGK